jgi:peptide deformylase
MKSGSTQSVTGGRTSLRNLRKAKTWAKGMLKVMYAAEGVGLAAPQAGVNKRLVVYNTSGDSKKWLEETILVNPEIIEYSDAKDAEIEGCLSFPDMNGEVTRSKWIKVQAMKGYPLVGRRFRSNHDSFL